MGLEYVEIVMDIEHHFGVCIPDEQASQIITVGDMHNQVADLLVAKGMPDTLEQRQQVWEGIVAIIARQMAMAPGLIKPTSTWVGDITQ